MAIIVLRSGDGIQPAMTCEACQQPGLLEQLWVGFAPLEEGVDVRECLLGHRRCLDGAAAQFFGVPCVTHWRARDFFATLLAPPTGITNPRLPHLSDGRRWSHRPGEGMKRS